MQFTYLLAILCILPADNESAEVTWIPSPNYGPRIDKQTHKTVDKPTMLVMHYTATNLSDTIAIFTRPNSTSAHYTIAENGTIYQHVDEKNRAWHAGVGQWRGQHDVNTYSIGIEHVNLGFRENPDQPPGIVVPGSPSEWYPFEQAQMTASISLAKQIVQRYGIEPRNVFAHGDSAVFRKVDPGPLFPWSEYAKEGVGAWIFEEDKKEDNLTHCPHTSILCMQKKLSSYGYTGVPTTGQFDDDTKHTVAAFQMHFRQENISGIIDHGTMKMIGALLKKYP